MKREIQVIDVDYQMEDDEVFLRVFGKTTEGENFLGIESDFKPYFYAVPADIDRAEESILESEFEHEDEKLPVDRVERVEKVDGRDEIAVLKVYTTVPPNVPKLRHEVEALEAVKECREFDIPFYKRFLIDSEITPMETLEVEGEEIEGDVEVTMEIDSFSEGSGEPGYDSMAFDLEVYDDTIIMASFYADDFQKVVSTVDIDVDFAEEVEGEKELLERLIDIITDRDVDILTGYNTDEFDFSVLRDRAEEHGLELALGRDGERMKFNRRGRFSSARLKGRMHLDIYPFVAHVLAPSLEAETLDLDSVAEELLGKKKDEMSWEDMKQSWEAKEDLEKFAKYCLKDSELAFELSEELVPQVLELSRLTGLIPFDACRLTYGQLTENFLLREAYRRDMIAPNRPSRSERSRRRNQGAYAGGFVYTPDAGIHENIALFDFRSLYPTVMVAHNISPDTLDVEGCDDEFKVEELGYSFCQDEQGFFPELVEDLVSERYELKKKQAELEEDTQEYKNIYNRQQAEKILANSFYGYLGYQGARWYSRESAETTTYLGRKYIEDTIEMAEEMGFEVVYGDTDSVFLKKEGIREEIDDFVNEVNSELPEFMELEFEGFFPRGFFTSTESGEGAKKKYALLAEDGSMKITGFEQVRRDWSPIAKETQERVLRKVLENEPEEAAELVKDTIERLKHGEVPVEKLRIYTTLTKKPENYDSTAPHVEAAKRAMERGQSISPGTTIDYVITSGSGTISSRAELARYAEDYDHEYYIENQVVPVAHRVLKVFGYTQDQLKGKGRQSGLDKFGK